ncbi:MAG: DNA topoisomerase I [Planctomycetes bacterium]|nr:DNA topoisomerase I [Planctomycetota bacterium]
MTDSSPQTKNPADPNKVIVVESGAKTRTIRRFLRGEYSVIACGGHIMDLPDDNLGIDIEDNFQYRPQPITFRGKSKVQQVRERLIDADEVYLATDPDREGEAIAADLLQNCLPPGATTRRIQFNAIVYHAVMEALDNPRDIDEDLVESQRARRALDRLIGFILSPMVQYHPESPGLPAVGRVLAPAVALVVDREKEIASFEVRKYWSLHARLTCDDETLTAKLQTETDDFAEARDIAQAVMDRARMKVIEREDDPNDEQNPPPPYTTDSLQDDADRLLNFTPERTMELAQELYQGVEIGEAGTTRALITYMRTDSTRVSPAGMGLAKKALNIREDVTEDLYRGRPWRPTAAAQDAHEAIRPTAPEDPDLFPEALQGKIPEPLQELYMLIYYRFLASQTKPAVYHTTELTLRSGDMQASATGSVLKKKGFLTLYRKTQPDYGREEISLPYVEEGTDLPVERAWPEREQTYPPPRYREGSLVRQLKELGIGRPSTYGNILRKIKKGHGGYGYVQKRRGKLRPTPRGESLCQYLRSKYEKVISYEYTKHMEEELEKIARGEEGTGYREFLQNEFQWLESAYKEAQKKDWISGDKPTPAQVQLLERLASDADIELPDEARKSRDTASRWIDKLRDEIKTTVRISDIDQVDVGGVPCSRVRLFYKGKLPQTEHDHLKSMGMKYQRPSGDRPPCYQYQRQDRERVEEVRDELLERFGGTETTLEIDDPGEE